MSVINIGSKEAFDEFIAEGTTLVDYFATWCGPCKMLSPRVDEAAKELADIKVCKVDIDELTELALRYRVQSVPTLILFKDVELVGKSIGLISKDEILEFARQ